MAQSLFQRARWRRSNDVLLIVAFLATVASFNPSSSAASLAGHPVQPGGTLDMQFPLNDYFQQYAARGGNPQPTTGRALLFFP